MGTDQMQQRGGETLGQQRVRERLGTLYDKPLAVHWAWYLWGPKAKQKKVKEGMLQLNRLQGVIPATEAVRLGHAKQGVVA